MADRIGGAEDSAAKSRQDVKRVKGFLKEAKNVSPGTTMLVWIQIHFTLLL